MKALVKVTLVAIIAAVAALGGVFAYAHAGSDTTVATPQHIAAPTTAKGYAKMFARIDTDVWGAADVSLSVPMSDGRSVWLYGDTFSGRYGMVHSTAITQDGGRLHVSNEGTQLLPDGGYRDGRQIIYWIETAKAAGANTIIATTEQVSIGADNGMDFKRANAKDRQALLKVDVTGDVTFVKWIGWTADPKIDQRFLTPEDGAPYQKMGHLFYSKRTHTEATLANGKTLVTICQNRDKPAYQANGQMDYTQYRPIFLAQ